MCISIFFPMKKLPSCSMFSLILEPYNTWYPGSSVIYEAKADGVTFNTAYSAMLARKGITYSGKI